MSWKVPLSESHLDCSRVPSWISETLLPQLRLESSTMCSCWSLICAQAGNFSCSWKAFRNSQMAYRMRLYSRSMIFWNPPCLSPSHVMVSLSGSLPLDSRNFGCYLCRQGQPCTSCTFLCLSSSSKLAASNAVLSALSTEDLYSKRLPAPIFYWLSCHR